MKSALLLLALLSLSACAGGPAKNYEAALKAHRVEVPKDYTRFQQCHAYGCREVDTIAFTKRDWKDIKKAFQPKAKSAEKERRQIAKAIAIFENKIGALNGTSADIHGTFKELGTEQLDCVDESINTTTYLILLQNDGLLKYHEVYSPQTRVPPLVVVGGWPHRTAVIAEKKTGETFAVDSWFWDNGKPAEVVPLKDWKAGWKPEGFLGG